MSVSMSVCLSVRWHISKTTYRVYICPCIDIAALFPAIDTASRALQVWQVSSAYLNRLYNARSVNTRERHIVAWVSDVRNYAQFEPANHVHSFAYFDVS